jgi:hypothetical protein
MAGIMFRLLRILPKKTKLPLIGGQSQGRPFMFQLLGKRCFPGTRKSNHQVKSCHTFIPREPLQAV